jgi:hypothetical protein
VSAIRHGYTLKDLDRLARIAAASARTGGLDSATCHGLAWSGIAEHLCTADEAPSRRDLVRAGQNAVHVELAACMHARGYQSGNTPAGPGASPRYWQYWHGPPEPNAMDRLIDHVAAIQIGELFTATEGSAVEALAIHEDYAAAADALGITYKRLAARIAAARRRFRTHWFAPDTPPQVRGHDKRRGNRPPRTHCLVGHSLDGDNLRIQLRRGGSRERCCRTCDRVRNKARWAAQKPAA